MENHKTLTNNPAARATAMAFGILSGLGGLTHGIGEVLQGSAAPSGIVFNSWAEGPIATNMGGEPAMTIVPNLLAAGVLTILVSLAMIAWSAAFVSRRNGGLVLILLAVAMLLVGGGFGPPFIGVLAGAAGLGIRSELSWWRSLLPASLRRLLARLWPWVYAITVINGVFLVVGSVVLVYFFGLNNPDLFTNSFLLSIPLLALTILTGIGYDLQNRPRELDR